LLRQKGRKFPNGEKWWPPPVSFCTFPTFGNFAYHPYFIYVPSSQPEPPPVAMQNAISGVLRDRLAFSYVLEPDPRGSSGKMLHLPLVQFNFGSHLVKKSNKVVTVQRQSSSYFTYAADDEVKQAKLRQAALCQVYEDFTGIQGVPDKPSRYSFQGLKLGNSNRNNIVIARGTPK